MERLFNDLWFFSETACNEGRPGEGSFAPVDLPHDALITDENNLYRDCDLWYKRILMVKNEEAAKTWLLHFDGVYMDCDVLLNGERIYTHHHGYTAFYVNLSQRLHVGENEILVHVRHRSPNTRWYSGAGIFRDVHLLVLEKHHILPDSVICHTEKISGQRWRITASCSFSDSASAVIYRLKDEEEHEVLQLSSDAFGFATAEITNPSLWSCDNPRWYNLQAQCGEQLIRQRVGFRDIRLTTDQGLLLNGEHIKLKGVCLHHDLGALGAAFNECAARRQLRLMQEMGVNSLRTSHNPPASKLLDICDEMGILVLDEFTDMWHRPKTEFDYARFFDAECRENVREWIQRDRNHPCVFMWSIGNEIPDTMDTPPRVDLSVLLRDEVRTHDATRPITMASNYMAWEGGQRCNEVLDAQGYNYAEKYYEAHHKEHPDWVIYGSETASVLSTRGIYHFPMSESILTDEDLQCSALGNSAASWGAQDLQKCICDDLNTPYSLGQYLWTGTDYIGEPTPYHTRSSYFGMADTAGYPKDLYYRFQAAWTEKKMIHIGVYWSWNPGQIIDVPVMTNCAGAELFLNGVSLGKKAVDTHSPSQSLPVWQVPYEAGVLAAVGYDESGAEAARDEQRSFNDAVRLHLESSCDSLRAGGEDLAFITVTALDNHGNAVQNANNRITISVTGAGRLMGLDNGDSTDEDGYQTDSRRLFSGKLLAIAGTTAEPGKIYVQAFSEGLQTAEITLESAPEYRKEGVSCETNLCRKSTDRKEIPIRDIRLSPLGETALTGQNNEVLFETEILPSNATPQEISFRVTNPAGIDSPCGVAVREGNRIRVTGKGDGGLILRATARNGADHVRIISTYPITVTGMGKPYVDPYGFVSAGLNDIRLNLTAGNEQGVATSRDEESLVGFENLDFGKNGSRRLTLPVFALDSEKYEIELYQGDPREGGKLIAVLPYQKKSIWNVYQPESWTLPVILTGIQTICFRLNRRKIHLKGFQFKEENRAWKELPAAEADEIYGDSFRKGESAVCGIGNNVSLIWRKLDFEGAGHISLTLDGCTPLDTQPITLRIKSETGEEITQLLNFSGKERHKQSFLLGVPNGKTDLSFVFLPGSNFDFYGLQMAKN